jgi:hypothetical protein
MATPVWWAPNPDDDPRIPAALDSAEARAAGILLVRLSPLSSTARHLALDVLASVGASMHGIDARHISASRLPDLAQAQLCGHQVQHLVIDRGERTTRAQQEQAEKWCDHLRGELWLLAPEALEHPQGDPRDLLKTAPQPVPKPPEWPDWLDHLVLPGADFTTFRAACRSTMPGEIFDVINSEYKTAFERTQLAEPWFPAKPALPDSYRIAETCLIGELIRDDPPAAIRVVRLRAVQAALFRRGTFVRWRPPVTGAAAADHLPGSLVTHHHAARLRAAADPTVAAANLLAGLLEVGASTLAELKLAQLHLLEPEVPLLDVGGAAICVPAWAAPVLRALWCTVAHQPAQTSDRLETSLFGTAGSHGALHANINTISRITPIDKDRFYPDDTSPVDTAEFSGYLRPFPDGWLHRRHLTIQSLPETPAEDDKHLVRARR